jgi:hypothetical protein
MLIFRDKELLFIIKFALKMLVNFSFMKLMNVT